MDITCNLCSNAPTPFPGPLVLHITTARMHLPEIVKLREALGSHGFPLDQVHPDVVSIPFSPMTSTDLANGISELLGGCDVTHFRSLVLHEGVIPTIADMMQTQPLTAFLARVQGHWLADLLEKKQLSSHFQPIVPAGDPNTAFAYECLLRTTDFHGNPVSPGRMYQVARDARMIHLLDKEARLAAIRCATEHGLLREDGPSLFINFLPSSIYDPLHCLKTTVAALAETAVDPGRVVFEVVESEKIEDEHRLARILDVYRGHGFKIALDDLGSGYGSLNLLHMLRPDFVKLDQALLRGAHQDPYQGEIASRLLDMARALGVKTIAEGIETAGELEWAQVNGADYVQGYHIARPAAVPPVPYAAAA